MSFFFFVLALIALLLPGITRTFNLENILLGGFASLVIIGYGIMFHLEKLNAAKPPATDQQDQPQSW